QVLVGDADPVLLPEPPELVLSVAHELEELPGGEARAAPLLDDQPDGLAAPPAEEGVDVARQQLPGLGHHAAALRGASQACSRSKVSRAAAMMASRSVA